MLELESRLLRLLKLVESITLEENIIYCANEILSILEKSEDINYRAREFSSTANVECDRPQYSLYGHVIRAIVSAARSNRLETHRCAQKILEVLRPYVSRRVFDELETDAEWSDFASRGQSSLFMISHIKKLKVRDRLNASLGDEFVHIIDPNEDIKEYMDRQRQALLDRIGLDLSTSEARKAQYHPEDPTRRLISKGDVDSGVFTPYESARVNEMGIVEGNAATLNGKKSQNSHEKMSSRQKNALKRKAKIEAKTKLFKRRRFGNLAVVADDQNLNSLFLFRELSCSLLDPAWQCRRGAAMCLPHLLFAILDAKTMFQTHANHKEDDCSAVRAKQFESLSDLMLQDSLVRYLSVMSLERFADFASDVIISPVQEKVSLSISYAVLHLSDAETSFDLVLKHLVETLMSNQEWQARYGAALAIQYIIKHEKHTRWYVKIFEHCAECMNDVSDDVRNVVAGALSDLTRHVHRMRRSDGNTTIVWKKEDCEMLLSKMTECLKDADNFCVSPSNVLSCINALLVYAKDYCQDVWVAFRDHFLELSSYLMHGITSVRVEALSLFRVHLVDFFKRRRIENGNIHQEEDYKLLTLLVEMLILDLDNEHIPTDKLKALIFAAIEEICNTHASWKYKLESWLELACTPNGNVFNRKMLLSTGILDVISRGSAERLRSQEKECLVNNVYTRIEKVSSPSTRVLLCEVIGYAITAVKAFSPSSNIIKVLLHSLSSSEGYRVSSAAQVIYFVTCSECSANFATAVKKQMVQYYNKTKVYAETKGLQDRVQYECRQLQQYFLKKVQKSYTQATKKGQKKEDSGFETKGFLKSLYKIIEVDRAHQLVDSQYLKWLAEAEARIKTSGIFDIFSLDMPQNPMHNTIGATVDENASNEASTLAIESAVCVNRIHGELDIYWKSHTIVDIEVRLSLCAAALRCIDLKCIGLPKNINPLVLPLLKGCKTVQNKRLRLIISSATTLLLKNTSEASSRKILSNICLYISRNDGEFDESIINKSVERNGGLAVLKDALGHYDNLSDPIFDVMWSTVNADVAKQHNTGIPAGLMILNSILDIYDLDIEECLDVHQTYLDIIKYHCDGPKVKVGIAIVRKIATRKGGRYFDDILTWITLKNTLDVLYTKKMVHLLEAFCHVSSHRQLIPYILLVLPTVMHVMNGHDRNLGNVAGRLIAWFLPYSSLESRIPDPNTFSDEMTTMRKKHAKLLKFLFVDERSSDHHPFVQNQIRSEENSCDPHHVSRTKLRPYQLKGVSWMLNLRDLGLHGLLCDDMGLGKTIQTLSVIAARWLERSKSNDVTVSCKAPSLVLCPGSVVSHWKSEISEHFKDILIPVSCFQITKDIKEFMYNPRAVIIMSYGLFRNNVDIIKEFFERWYYVVLDEGHVISNMRSQIFSDVKSLHAQHRLVLSGTPLQNSAMELFSIFEFLMPGYLGTAEEYRKNILKPIEAVQPSTGGNLSQNLVSNLQYEQFVIALEKVHKKVLPFLKRRLKVDVLKDLPEKIIQDRICIMPDWQKTAYNQVKSISNISDGLACQTNLRKACTHPSILNEEVLKILRNGSNAVVQSDHNDYGNDDFFNHDSVCAKIDGLKHLFAECGIRNNASMEPTTRSLKSGSDTRGHDKSVETEHRIVIFVQYNSTINFLENNFCRKFYPNLRYLRLDRKNKAKEREKIIHAFNSDRKYTFLLTTTRVGGLGINLTGADTVVFFEHDWNPQKDLQAMDRVHRLGQTRVTNVFRLLCKDTIEEKVMSMQRFKLHLSKTIVDAAATQSTTGSDK